MSKAKNRKALAFVTPQLVAAIQQAELNHPEAGSGPIKRAEVIDIVIGIIVAFGLANDTPALRLVIGLAVDGIIALINGITKAGANLPPLNQPVVPTN